MCAATRTGARTAERAGALRWAARMFAAQHRLRVPKISVTLRKAFGFGSSIMAMNPFDDQTLSLALPGVSLGAMPARGGGAAAKVGEETQADLDAAEGAGPYSVANGMGFDEIIDPRDLRNALLMMQTKHGVFEGPEKLHFKMASEAADGWRVMCLVKKNVVVFVFNVFVGWFC